jgi:hypothetical protein
MPRTTSRPAPSRPTVAFACNLARSAPWQRLPLSMRSGSPPVLSHLIRCDTPVELPTRRSLWLNAVAPSRRSSHHATAPSRRLADQLRGARGAGSSAAAARGPRSPPGRTAMPMIRNTTTPMFHIAPSSKRSTISNASAAALAAQYTQEYRTPYGPNIPCLSTRLRMERLSRLRLVPVNAVPSGRGHARHQAQTRQTRRQSRRRRGFPRFLAHSTSTPFASQRVPDDVTRAHAATVLRCARRQIAPAGPFACQAAARSASESIPPSMRSGRPPALSHLVRCDSGGVPQRHRSCLKPAAQEGSLTEGRSCSTRLPSSLADLTAAACCSALPR